MAQVLLILEADKHYLSQKVSSSQKDEEIWTNQLRNSKKELYLLFSLETLSFKTKSKSLPNWRV
jgi:hypothetical protein